MNMWVAWRHIGGWMNQEDWLEWAGHAFEEFGINVFTVWETLVFLRLGWMWTGKQEFPACVCWFLCPVHTTSHVAMFKSVAFLSSLHPFSGKPSLCVRNKVTDPILKGILFEGKYLKLNERIYPNCQIFFSYSLGPQSQHYPWEEVKSTYQEPLLNMLII